MFEAETLPRHKTYITVVQCHAKRLLHLASIVCHSKLLLISCSVCMNIQSTLTVI